MNLGSNVYFTTCLAYASGTAARNGAELDMQGYDGVMAIMMVAAAGASNTGDLHFETATVTGFSGGTDLLGTAIVTDGDSDDEIFVVEIYKPLERYLRAVVTKDTTNTIAESVIYLQYKGAKRPTDNIVTDVCTHELHVSPARGTK